MLLLNTVVVLALASAPPAKPVARAGCATTNIETALQHLETHLKASAAQPKAEVSEEELARLVESGEYVESVAEEFIGKDWKVRDVPNGFVSTGDKNPDGTYEAALFKNPEGYHLVLVGEGVSVTHIEAFRCDKDGFKADNAALRISTAQALQLYADAGLIAPKGKKGLQEKTLKDWGGSILDFHLPRKGRSIRVTAGVDEPASVYGKALGTLEYVDSKFVVRSLAKKPAP
ncbi:hypothetical protein D7X74_37425 [Corallococcus sp. CA047B]|uniref:hypothetical protein n=1 Tax=Corallococcus sp. CA047B TaxID=2316729 RepID=UPI000EA382D4|nr:hypothetical protein [Corallococcus sp. CA047B]RKH02059.1 hypothetical protein D7X74_37425 [Corallococcus sp. CA047B]